MGLNFYGNVKLSCVVKSVAVVASNFLTLVSYDVVSVAICCASVPPVPQSPPVFLFVEGKGSLKSF